MNVYEKFRKAAEQGAVASLLTPEHEQALDRIFEKYAQYRMYPTTFKCETGIVFFDIPTKDVTQDVEIPGVPEVEILEASLGYWKRKINSDGRYTTVTKYWNDISVVVCTDPRYVFARKDLTSSGEFRTYNTTPVPLPATPSRKRARPAKAAPADEETEPAATPAAE